jgi:hypothetical protein
MGVYADGTSAMDLMEGYLRLGYGLWNAIVPLNPHQVGGSVERRKGVEG